MLLNNKGTILMLVVISAFVMSIVGLGTINMMGMQEIQARGEVDVVQAGHLADAGIEYAKVWLSTACIRRHTFPERARQDEGAADLVAPFVCSSVGVGAHGHVTVTIAPDPLNGPNNIVKGIPSNYFDGINPFTESPGFSSGYYTITATGVYTSGTRVTTSCRSITLRYYKAGMQFSSTGDDTKAAGFNTVTLLSDASTVLVAGGSSKYSPEIVGSDGNSSAADITNAASIYNPDANNGAGGFDSVGNMVRARAKHTATLLSDGKVLMAGGYGSDGTEGVLQAELYNPISKSFSYVADMRERRTCHNAVLIASTNEVLLMGGFKDLSNYNNSIESYHGGAFHWVTNGGVVQHMSVPRHCFVSLTLPNGDVFIAGGKTSTTPSPYANVYTNNIDIYIPHSAGHGEVIGGMHMLETRRDFSAELIHASISPGTTQYRILCVGGYIGTSAWDTQTKRAEIVTLTKSGGGYSCSTAYTDSLSASRSDMFSAQISPTQWIFAGGIDDAGNTVDTCEIYSTVTGTFTQLADDKDMDPARHCENNSLTTDKNGDILLTGGWSSGEVATKKSGRLGPERLIEKKRNSYVEMPVKTTY